MLRRLSIPLALLFVTAPALADVVGPPPDECPRASTPSSSHSGPLCVPSNSCDPASGCDGGACVAIKQCIEKVACGGMMPPDAGPCTVDNVVGECGSGDSCSVGTCTERSICSTGSDGSSSTSGSNDDDGGCGCRAAGGDSAPEGAAWLLLLGAVALGRGRRR